MNQPAKDDVRWRRVALLTPPENTEVWTKIHDHRGCRNVQTLKRVGRRWHFPDMSMYVYYEPTHWAFKEDR